MLIAAMLGAKNRAGEKLMKEGGEAEVRKEYDKALAAYEKAYSADPKDPAYQMAVRRMRFQAATSHVSLGQKIRTAGNLEESLNEFQKAYATDPSLAIAEQEIRRTKEMMEREKKKPASPGTASASEDRGLTPSQRALKEMEAKSASILSIPELRPITRQISTLKMNNQPIRVLYETVGKLAGINVVFDSEIQPPPGGKNTFTVDLSNTTLEEALDYLAIQTRTYWKPLSTNAIFITNDNVQKRRDFEDYVVKVFYIKNATLLQELQEISTTVRSVTEIRRAFTYGAQNAILVRGTSDQVALAEKLILDLDKPKAEVVVDIIVMQASRSRARDLAATLAYGSAAGINSLPITYGVPAATTTAADGTKTTPASNSLALNRLTNISIHDFSVAVPGGLIQALMSDSTTRVLQQPQVRAVDGQKASLRIGDKVPYATGSFGGGLGASVGVGVSPLVSTQFSFAEVGVNVDLTPKVHGRDEVSLHIELEISNVSSYVKIGDISQPVISQKKIAHDIRIREGEVSLLGGLMQVQDSKLVAGLPWLANLPVLGALFGTHHQDNSDSELLIALIPHIVRAPDYSDANLRAVSAGTDQNVKLSYAPRPETAAPPQAAPLATPSAGTPVAPAPAALVPAEPSPAAGPVRVFFNPPNVQTQLSGVVTVALQIDNASDLFAVPMKLKFDPKILRLSSVKEGNLMGGDGQKINFSENTLNDTGDATVVLNRLPGSGGISGSGALVNLTFQAVGRGTSMVTVSDLTLVNSTSKPIVAAPPLLSVVVQ